MSVRKLSASYLFTLNGTPLKDGIVVVSATGEILDIIDVNGNLSEIEGLERYSGVLVPGFVNAHCHLEYSYCKDLIDKNIGVPAFIEQMSQRTISDETIIKQYAIQADRYMKQTGCVAVGDISTDSMTLEIKKQSGLFYYTFIECLALHPKQAPRMVEKANSLGLLYESNNQKWSYSPHATYSVSRELLQLIAQQKQVANNPISFHYLESAAEDLLHRSKQGAFADLWNRLLSRGFDFWEPSGKNASEATIPFFSRSTGLLLIHSLHLNEEHLQLLKRERDAEHTFLVTCPRSNLYIENQLPDYQLWQSLGFPIAIGTDSLASNSSLAMIEEMKCLQDCANIDFGTALSWACQGGAKALNIEDWAGSLEKGKRPGVNLVTGIDLRNFRLLPHASAKRLV